MTFVITPGCNRNCSFSSGDGAGAFFAMALTFALSRRRAVAAAAIGFGALVSFSRVAVGAHFFSDVLVSFFVMLIVADVLHHYMLSPKAMTVEQVSRRRAGILLHPQTRQSVSS